MNQQRFSSGCSRRAVLRAPLAAAQPAPARAVPLPELQRRLKQLGAYLPNAAD